MKYFIAALLAGLGMAVWGFLDYQKMSKLDRGGVVTDGVVVNQQAERNRRSTSYYLTVNYTPAGKNPITKSFIVSQSYYNLKSVGGSCKVKYLPNDPETAIILGGSLDASDFLWIGSAIAAVGLIGSVVMMAFKRKPAEPQAGPAEANE